MLRNIDWNLEKWFYASFQRISFSEWSFNYIYDNKYEYCYFK